MAQHDRVVSLAFFEIDSVETLLQQDESGARLPRHLTIAPPIEHARGATNVLRDTLAQCAMRLGTFEIVGGEAAALGTNGEYSARLIVPTRQLQEVHWDTIAALEEIIEADQYLEEATRSETVERMMHYSGARYNPHITDKPGNNLQRGERREISRICLGQREGSLSDGGKISRVIGAYNLTGE